MKKSTLLLAAFACIVSCSKNGNTQPTPEPETPLSLDFVIAAAPDQFNYIRQSFVLCVGTDTVKINDFEMTNVTTGTNFPNFKERVSEKLAFVEGPESEFYSINIGTIQNGQTVKCVKCSPVAVQSRPSTAKFDYYVGGIVLVDGKEVIMRKSVVELSAGVHNTEEAINLFCDQASETFKLEYTCGD